MNRIFNRTSLFSALALTLGGASFQISAQEWEGSIGLGAVVVDAPWKGMDTYVSPFPVFSAEYGRWELFSNGIVSYNWIDQEDMSFYSGIDYRDDTYDADDLSRSETSDDPVFDGYDSPDGDVTFKVGGRWQWFSVDIQQDISGNSKGLTIDGGASVPVFQYGDRFALMANAFVHWESDKYANHVYGIAGKQIDVSKGRTAFQPGSLTSYSLGLDASYQINENWGVFGGLSYTKLDSKLEDSPLIDDDKVALAYLGVAYAF